MKPIYQILIPQPITFPSPPPTIPLHLNPWRYCTHSRSNLAHTIKQNIIFNRSGCICGKRIRVYVTIDAA